ncbi:MAG: hypothetical protein ACLP50_11710 [Solirubrobacteraceae bacterium]
MEGRDDGDVLVTLLRDAFSLVRWHFAADDRVAEELVGVSDNGAPPGEVFVVDRGVRASCWLARRDHRAGP